MQTEFQTYLQPTSSSFWQYESEEQVLAVFNGSTIAYVNYVKNVLEDLQEQGVPPFGSLLLVISTTNQDGLSNIELVEMQMQETLQQIIKRHPWQDILRDAMRFLRVLCELPTEYKSGKKRVLLFQTLFENCHNLTSSKNTKVIIENFNARSFEALISDNEEEILFRNFFYKDFQTLSLIGRKYPSVNSILKKMGGLPEVEEEIPLLPADQLKDDPKDFVEQLMDNYKTFHVGALIKRIWSGINIPSQNALPSSQPLGGVSDLTNKGEFDRLLISEFANDEVVFMSRLANNEALYIQREIPPTDEQLERIFLIDVSLKNWGTPKTVAYAIMLAIANHPKSEMACSAFAVGKNYILVAIETIDDIIDGLQILDGSLGASEGIKAFFKENPTAKNAEVFFVTEPSTLKKIEVLKTLNEHRADINYLIQTDAEGGVEVFKNRKNGRKHLQSIRLPLGELWAKKKRPEVPKEEEPEVFLPSKYPILMPQGSKMKKVFTAPDGEIFKITKDRNLFRYFEKNIDYVYNKGWDLIYENLGFSTSQVEMGISPKGDYILLAYIIHKKEIVLLNIQTGERKVFSFPHWKMRQKNSVVFHQEEASSSNNQKSRLYPDGFYHAGEAGLWRIGFNGNFEKVTVAIPKWFEERNKEIHELMQKHRYFNNVYKNIREVSISARGNLIIGIHELQLVSTNYIQFLPLNDPAFSAEKINQHLFQFADGSTVEVKPFGMIVLKSSNPEIPEIFVPTAIQNHLGIATNDDFAGNEFYYKGGMYEVFVENGGTRKLALVKGLKNWMGVSLKEAKEFVDNLPGMVPPKFSKERATLLKSHLEGTGAKATINLKKSKVSTQKQVAPKEFFEKYINPFIQNILKHEA